MRLGGMSQRHSEIPRSAMLRDHERQGGSPLVRGPLHTDTPIGRGTYPTDGTWPSLQPIVPLKFRITLVRAVGGRAQVCIRVLSLTPDPRELPGSTQVLDRPMLGGRSELLRRRLELEKPLVSGSVQVDAVPLIPAYTLHIKHLAHAPAREVIERPCAGIRDDEAHALASNKKKVFADFRRRERSAHGVCPREVAFLRHLGFLLSQARLRSEQDQPCDKRQCERGGEPVAISTHHGRRPSLVKGAAWRQASSFHSPVRQEVSVTPRDGPLSRVAMLGSSGPA